MPFDAEVPEKSSALLLLKQARAKVARAWMQVAPGGHQDRTWWGAPKIDTVCLILALYRADRNHDYFYFHAALRALGFNSAKEAEAWNDAKGRTKAQVLARLDAAIATLSA